ncbi:MAG TPA: CpsD/CapB family tyrosine-protein kinase, partial [Actinomycetota bacterium]
VLLEHIDNRILSREEIELALAPLPILAAIPEASRSRKRTLFFSENESSHVAESFRILRTNAQFFSVNEPLGRVLVTSPHGKDGKTTVAVNLAASLAASGLRTVLVEADLRRPCASTYFELPPAPGLSDVLVGRSELSEAIRATGVANLLLVPAGTVPPNPSELLGSKPMVSILDELAADGSVVVLDSPPALVVTDAAVLAAQTDEIVLVVRAGRTHRDGAREVKRLFERIGAPIVGVVINCARRGDAYGYPHRYYRYLRNDRARLPSEHESNGHVEPGTTSMPGKVPPLAPDHKGESVPPVAPALRAGPLARHRNR